MKPESQSTLPAPRRERGSALLIILALIGIGAAFLLVSALMSNPQIGRDKITAAALAQAKEALIGVAATYRDAHPDTGGHMDKVFGYLPCPDINNDGLADPPCGGKNITVAGRLPWKTLGLPPSRDGAGECLWYVVSGRVKDNPYTDSLNWDTVGQIEVQDASGQVLAAQDTHDTPWAAIIGPGGVTGTQDRTPAGTSECGGNNNAAAYLEGLTLNPAAGLVSTLVLATNDSAKNGTNNDRGLWISSREIFDRVEKRSDFAADIGTLLTNLKTTLDAAPPPLVTAFNTASTIGCPVADGSADQINDYFRCNWNNNLRFAESAGITVNGAPCDAVLIFAGERATGQARATPADQSNKANYLEAPNLGFFPGTGAYSGAVGFDPSSASTDIVRCIQTGSPPPTQVTFASDFGSFQPFGAGVTTDPVALTVTVAPAAGSSGGCFWFPTAVPLDGKTLRAYLDFTFADSDPIGGQDRGNGFTLSFLRGDVGAPNACGTQSYMGVLDASPLWGNISLSLETDVHQDNANNEPNGTANHTAIMANGNITHSATNGNLTSACNGTAQGCLYTPANTFEESPTPPNHNQRIEIHTGYNDATCSSAGAGYAQIKVWTDCVSCSGTASDFVASSPKAGRCVALDASMDSIYFGFTGGFRSGASSQGVTIRNLDLRTQ